MIKRILAVLAILLFCNCAAPAQDVKPQPGATPGAAQAGGQPSLPGGLAGGSGSPGSLGGEGQADGKKKKDSGEVFEFLAKGRTYFLATETKSLREPLEVFLKERGITNGQVTRELYTQFTDQRKAKMAGGAATGQGIGGPVDGVIGGKYTKEKDLKDMTLEELLASAIKNNPDIRVAESKVREAAAELNRTRQQVLQKVAQLRQEIALAGKVSITAQILKDMTTRSGKAVSERDRIEATLTHERAKAELAKLEAELPYLIGKQPATMSGMGGMSSGGPSMGSSGGGPTFAPMPGGISGYGAGALGAGLAMSLPAPKLETLHKALDTELLLRQSDMTLHDAMSFIAEKMLGNNVHISDKKLNESKVNMYFRQPVTIGAIFQFIEDELQCQCVVREYGIVIAPRDRVPPGATPLLDSWKKARAAESKPK